MIFSLYSTKLQMSTLFLRDRPWHSVHVFNVPLPSLSRIVFFLFFCFFSTEIWDPLRPKYPPKTQKPKYLAEKKRKKKKPIRERLGRGTLNTCAKFQGLSLQNGVDIWTLKEFGVSCLNQPVAPHKDQSFGTEANTRYSNRSANFAFLFLPATPLYSLS